MRIPDVILAGASVRSLAESASADGLVPLCIDQFADRDLATRMVMAPRVVDNYAEIADAISNVADSVPLILTGGAESDVLLRGRLNSIRPVGNLSIDLIDILNDPEELFRALASGGSRVPRWSRTIAAGDSARWLTKVRASSGGMGVCFGASNHAAEDTFFQEFVDGTCFSASFYSPADGAIDGPVLVGTSLQLSGEPSCNAGGFAFCGNVGIPNPSPELRAQVCRLATTVAQQYPMRGFWGIDCVLAENDVVPIELNSRITATHELHTGTTRKSHAYWQLAAFGCVRDSDVPEFSSVAIARLVIYASRRLTVSAAASDLMMNHSAPSDGDQIWLADIPDADACVAAGTPLCSLYVSDVGHVEPSRLREVLAAIPTDTSKIDLSCFEKFQGQIRRLQKLEKN